MPRGDGTGPMGYGPMTGRAAGYCAGYNTPGFANPALGRGLGMGRGCGGGGRGWRNQFYATGLPGYLRFSGAQPMVGQPEPQQEKLALKAQAEAIQKRLEELEKAGQ